MELQERVQRASLGARYLEQDVSTFTNFIDERWEAAGRIVDFLKGEVERGSLEPLDAGKIIACSQGQLFGYPEFHASTSPDVVQALIGQLPR